MPVQVLFQELTCCSMNDRNFQKPPPPAVTSVVVGAVGTRVVCEVRPLLRFQMKNRF